MTLVTRVATASLDASSAMFAPQIPDLLAGEDIDNLAPCYIESASGTLKMSDGTAATEPAEIVGFAAGPASLGEPVTVFGKGLRMKYGSGLTPGDILFIAATAGRLDDAASVGDAVGVARVLTDTDIQVIRDA